MLFCHVNSPKPKYFTAFLTPPINDKLDMSNHADLLKLAVQDKFDRQDLSLLTKMDVSIPVTTQDLKHHIKNYTGCAGRCFGQESVLYMNLHKVLDHIEDNETCYTYEFREESLFGGHLLDRINYRVHKFLESCASGDKENINVQKIDFSDYLDQIENREYRTKIPVWISGLMKRRSSSSSETNNTHSGSNGSGTKRRQFQEGKRG